MAHILQIGIILIIVSISVIITILLLKKILKFLNRDNIEVEAKISGYNTIYGPHPNDIYYTPILSYKVNNIEKRKQYELINTKEKGAKIKIIINKYHGNIITTKFTKNFIILLFVLNSIITAFLLYNLFAYISYLI